MTNREIKIREGLRPLPEDKRDFQTGRVFGALPVEALPREDFIIRGIGKIKDQGFTDYCTGYGVTLASENQEKVELNPEFQFAATKKISGDPERWGADLRSACKSAVKFGSLLQQLAKFNANSPREKVTNLNEYGDEMREVAMERRKHSFFAVTGPYDTFDNIRSATLQHKQPVVTGSYWRAEWDTPNGIIPTEYSQGGFGHCFVFIGQTVINEELYLVAQNSAGTKIGASGWHFFPREVVNRECTWGNFVFVDLPADEAAVLNKFKLSISWLWLAKIVAKVKRILRI